ncbi:hypothetical protein [Rhodococcus sp. X156]|uniref:hypothetical protein n=1 Tax=Rhodococcus sp. X156 TaxID=2499145 RepID=UPI000FD6E9A2|nr:hypothetical protein [Rhodococcus sp. X156]
MRGLSRAAAVTGLVGVCATGLSVLGAGTAAAAPADVAVESCTVPVQANPGDRLVVSAKTLLAPQMQGLSTIPLVGPALVDALTPALKSLSLPPFVVSADRAPVTGAQIADALVVAIPAIPPPAVQPLRDAISSACTLTVVPPGPVQTPEAVPSAAAVAAAPAAAGPVPGAVAPGAGVAPNTTQTAGSASTAAPAGQSSYGRVPRYTYNDLTAVPSGGAGYTVGVAPTLPPKSLSGYGLPALPSLGVPGAAQAPGLAPQTDLLRPGAGAATSQAQPPAVQPASSASVVTAMPTVPAASTKVPAEAVVAALLLSLTTAAVVRTWVLRRTAPLPA